MVRPPLLDTGEATAAFRTTCRARRRSYLPSSPVAILPISPYISGTPELTTAEIQSDKVDASSTLHCADRQVRERCPIERNRHPWQRALA